MATSANSSINRSPTARHPALFNAERDEDGIPHFDRPRFPVSPSGPLGSPRPISRSLSASAASASNAGAEAILNSFEAEQEAVVLGLMRKLDQLRREKAELEQALEVESEAIVNRLLRAQSQVPQSPVQMTSPPPSHPAPPVSSWGAASISAEAAGSVPGLSASSAAGTDLGVLRAENAALRTKLEEMERKERMDKQRAEKWRTELVKLRTRLGMPVEDLLLPNEGSASRSPSQPRTVQRQRSSSVDHGDGAATQAARRFFRPLGVADIGKAPPRVLALESAMSPPFLGDSPTGSVDSENSGPPPSPERQARVTAFTEALEAARRQLGVPASDPGFGAEHEPFRRHSAAGANILELARSGVTGFDASSMRRQPHEAFEFSLPSSVSPDRSAEFARAHAAASTGLGSGMNPGGASNASSARKITHSALGLALESRSSVAPDILMAGHADPQAEGNLSNIDRQPGAAASTAAPTNIPDVPASSAAVAQAQWASLGHSRSSPPFRRPRMPLHGSSPHGLGSPASPRSPLVPQHTSAISEGPHPPVTGFSPPSRHSTVDGCTSLAQHRRRSSSFRIAETGQLKRRTSSNATASPTARSIPANTAQLGSTLSPPQLTVSPANVSADAQARIGAEAEADAGAQDRPMHEREHGPASTSTRPDTFEWLQGSAIDE